VSAKRLLWPALIFVLAAFFAATFSANLFGGTGIGDPVPQSPLVTLDGVERRLDDWRGRPLILRFSSAACTYCSRDFELLDRLQAQAGEGVQVIAVQVGDAPASVRAALMGASPQIPVVIDSGAELARALGIRSLPSAAFVTARGTLSSVVGGEIAEIDVGQHLRLAALGGPDFREDLRWAAQRLRCRECEGRSVWESDARSSLEIRAEIERRLLAGERPEEIVAGFREVYGDWILMAPPMEGIGSLVWLLPSGAVVAGALLWFAFLRRRGRQGEAPAGAEDAGTESGPREALERRVKEYM